MPFLAGLLIAAAIAIAAQVGIATLTWLSVRRVVPGAAIASVLAFPIFGVGLGLAASRAEGKPTMAPLGRTGFPDPEEA